MKQLSLKRIELKNFCGFKSYTMDFDSLTILVGPNNGGKSTIMRATAFAWKSFRLAWGASRPQILTLLQQWRSAITSHNLNLKENERNVSNAVLIKRQEETLHKQLIKTISDIRRKLNIECKLADASASLALPESRSLFYGHDLNNSFAITLDVTISGTFYRLSVSSVGSDKLEIQLFDETHTSLFECDSPDNLESIQRSIDEIATQDIEYLPPVITLLPAESALAWPDIEKLYNAGKEFEVWRNRMHWLFEGRDPESIKRVIARVTQSLNDVTFRSPSRTRDAKAKVRINYTERGLEFDISESGAGLRTLFAISAQVELSNSTILLLDEPDSHLHSHVQRQVAEFLTMSAGKSKQIVVSTHAPDMIEEFPLECLHWIDKNEPKPQQADDLSTTLVNLGAISHNQALRIIDSTSILYFEDKPDEKVFLQLIKQCERESLLTNCTIARLNGAGDAVHLSTISRFLENHHGKQIPMLALIDSDYAPAQDCNIETDGLVFIARLPCKELENLILMQPQSIFNRVNDIIEQNEINGRANDTQVSLEEISSIIDICTGDPDLTNQVRLNWITRRFKDKSPVDAGQLGKLEADFASEWSDPLYRRRYCPGKKVLHIVKKQLQEKHSISFSDISVFSHYEVTPELDSLFAKMENHLQVCLGDQPDKSKQ